MEPSYNPKDVEEKWYRFWESHGLFKPNPNATKGPYCIILPPPNVTGRLHMGHVLGSTIQDALIRRKRMQGFKTLWVPGTDHAGIATQAVVERHLFATTGKRRTDFEREAFLSQIWEWKRQYEQDILNQFRRIGASLDWSKLCFTLDEKATRAVRVMFKSLFDQGLIYRGDYLVNWDPILQTVIADDEVEYEERPTSLWHIRYPVDGGGHITVATTRPETIPGDTAVAVSPKDPRYQHLIGKEVLLPLSTRKIPIIADPYVDPTFGTGAVKITPAHDMNDYEVGKRHNLPSIHVAHLDREGVLRGLRDQNLLEKVEPHTSRVGISYRSKAVVEPYLSKQWFVKMGPFKEALLDAVRSGRVTVIPKELEKTYFHWIENLRDWCISRQLWWGHQIPVWYRGSEVVCSVTAPEGDGWIQDTDVLDTWFSSALWPLTTLGWPDHLSEFYPTSTLVTGHDILFFWVARMILMGEFAVNQVPFKETFIHGLIYGKSYWRIDSKGDVAYVPAEERIAYELGKSIPPGVHTKWEKMSKSKGNVIDPLEIIDQYGTDAMRFALLSSATHARQIDLDRRRFEEYKNFANKLWNAARFVLSTPYKGEEVSPVDLEDRWILSRLDKTVTEVNQHLDAYNFHEATHVVYHFFWDEFCAYYIELSKKRNKQAILYKVLETSLRLMHPFVPFITEEIYSLLNQKTPCITAPYPEAEGWRDLAVEEAFQKEIDLVHALRAIRAELQIPLGQAIDVYVSKLPSHPSILQSLVKIRSLHEGHCEGATAIVHDITVSVPLPEELKEKERLRLHKEFEKLGKQITTLETQLCNEDFIARAPAHLVQKTKDSLLQARGALSELAGKLQSL